MSSTDVTSPSVRREHLLDQRDLRNRNIAQPKFGGPVDDNNMPQPLAGPAHPQLQPLFQMRQGNQLLATYGVDYNERLLDGFQNRHAERVNQRRNRLRGQEQVEDQAIQQQEALRLQRQEQQLAEDHVRQEREVQRQEAVRRQAQHADLQYEEEQAEQVRRVQRAAQEELERREEELTDQAHRAASVTTKIIVTARDAVDRGEDLNEPVAARNAPRMPRPQRLANEQNIANRRQAQVIRQEAQQPYVEPLYRHTLRNMEVECRNCGTLYWDIERLTSSSRIHPKFGVCCLQGQVRLDPFQEAPAALHRLFCGVDITAREFHNKVCSYNNAFAFTSLGVKIDHAVTSAAGPYSFRIHRGLHHSISAFHPPEGETPSFGQLYIHDPQTALFLHNENNRGHGTTPATMLEVQDTLEQFNPFIPLYKQAYQIIMEKPEAEHEVAAVIPGDGEQDVDEHRDIVLRLKQFDYGGGLKHISHLHPLYSPLHYVLLFPFGEQGWHRTIGSIQNADGNIHSEYVSQRCYYAYRLHPRRTDQSNLFYGGKLLQEYCVDAWASTEESELKWVRHHQKDIRADLYQSVKDAMDQNDGEIDLGQQGQNIVLPSSHSGSTRHMYQLFQDSMAICCHCRKPDIFLTMTANTNWPEIQEALLEYHNAGEVDDDPDMPARKQTAADRPDIVARVFYQKKKALLKEVKDGNL
ncbi:hypothetical protein SERLA73DRAFT_70687 [Serpula lacrymans var. lacrymans S7.3]|uniref:Helitron helicase-like domain-containing protein n=1 Tax=Serpula lacrymans var. lacrymans (strain S7.3) TaxID=936435 RepID=F8PQ42_SERL3|nr:hypothetical protein SERLA73DRAFT_70687 [Serpula lacrymans var. lacrymans S7.3]